jgi:hypothetical protein
MALLAVAIAVDVFAALLADHMLADIIVNRAE